MKSSLGWTLFSQDALKRAETQLRDEVTGVVDEIGFLYIHQAYANYFFPGTSVLQTRLRYALFVPWMFQKVAKDAKSGLFRNELTKEEVQLAGRLKQSNEEGIIGGRSHPKPTSQPANMVYWTALRTWGILRPRIDGSYPNRFDAMRLLGRHTDSRLRDDDDQPIEHFESVFVGLPEPPEAWKTPSQPITFELDQSRGAGDRSEATWLRRQLIGVVRPNSRNQPSLLSVLVEKQFHFTEDVGHAWDRRIKALLPEPERDKLTRAQQVASLAAIGRAVYGALVARIMQDNHEANDVDHFQVTLEGILADHAEQSEALDIDMLVQDTPNIPGYLQQILRATQTWLSGTRSDLMALYDPYCAAEVQRKGRRARLPRTLFARERRLESKPPDAYPLSFRWRNVQRMLRDLEQADD